MSSGVLVAYATRYGATAEVAEAVAKALRDAGLAVKVRNVREVRDVRGYDAIVFGTPVYLARVLRAGRTFVKRHRRALAGMRVAAFVIGVEPEQGKRRRIDRLLAKGPAIRPISVGVFGGLVDGSRLRWRHKTPPIRKLMPLTDTRDWDAIAAWAGALGVALTRNPRRGDNAPDGGRPAPRPRRQLGAGVQLPRQ